MERLEMLENETNIELANRMLAKKQETGKEVESSINGIIVTTEGCQTVGELQFKISEAYQKVAEDFEEEYSTLVDEAEQDYLMAAYIEQYKKRTKNSNFSIFILTPDEEEVHRKEQEIRKEAGNRFRLNFMTKDSIDWNDSNEVYGWIETIRDDLNDYNAQLPLAEIYSEEELNELKEKYDTDRLSSAQIVVEELNKHGYTNEKIEVSNEDDLNKQLISMAISELEKYGLLLTRK